MTAAGLAERGMSRRQLQRLQDARRGEPHPWAGWTTADLATAIANHPIRGHLQGRRLRPQLMRTLDRHVDTFRRITHATGPLYIGSLERVILEAGRDDRGGIHANLAQGKTTLYRRLRELEAIGALRWGHYERPDCGNGGVWIELLTPDKALLEGISRSSVHWSDARVRAAQTHRRQTRRERREHRHAPRKRRFDAPPRRDFAWSGASSRPPKLVQPFGVSPGSPPTGASPGETTDTQAVRGHERVTRSSAAPGLGAVAAPGAPQNGGHREGGPAVLLAAARRGDPPVPLVLAAWRHAWPDRGPRLSPQRRAELERDSATYDRLNGEVGAAAAWLLEQIAEHRRGAEPPPASLGRFVVLLRRATAAHREAWRLAREADGRPYRRAARRHEARVRRRTARLAQIEAELARRNEELPWLA